MLLPTATPESEGAPSWGAMEVEIVPLETTGQPLWAAYSVGMRMYEPDQPHFVAIYGHDGGEWRELSRVVFTACAEYVGEGALTQVQVDPERVWLELQSGAGAHSGCYDVLSFDGDDLRIEVTHFNSSPGAGNTADLDGDGYQEVVLNTTENYVFCYACGVRLQHGVVLRWNGEALEQVELAPLPPMAPAELADLNNRAVELAGGELWKDAQATIAEAALLAPADLEVAEILRWNEIVIDLIASARAEQVEQGTYPLLENAFYGDYEAAVDVMRQYDVEQIWRLDSPLIAGTVAEGWEMVLSDWISVTTSAALEVRPDLAPAHFLRGWGAFLSQPENPQVAVPLVARAAELAPVDLCTASLDHLQAPSGPYTPIASDACYALGEAMMSALQVTVTLSTAPFEDYIESLSGTGCQAVATGTGEQFPDGMWPVAEQLGAILEQRGYTPDMMYAADAPVGTSRGYRRDGQLCILSVMWELAEGVECPADRPIVECEFEPWQQIYTIALNCAEKDAP